MYAVLEGISMEGRRVCERERESVCVCVCMCVCVRGCLCVREREARSSAPRVSCPSRKVNLRILVCLVICDSG